MIDTIYSYSGLNLNGNLSTESCKCIDFDNGSLGINRVSDIKGVTLNFYTVNQNTERKNIEVCLNFKKVSSLRRFINELEKLEYELELKHGG